MSAQVSAIFKIALGLMQCLSTLRSFSKVRWPETFAALIEAVDLFLIEAFAVVPAECIVGHRLGFFYELCATLTLPLISFLVIMLMAVLLYGWELHAARNSRQQHEDTLLQMLNRPQVWTLNILAWLVLFPSVTRKSLEAFDCVDLLPRRFFLEGSGSPPSSSDLLVASSSSSSDWAPLSSCAGGVTFSRYGGCFD